MIAMAEPTRSIGSSSRMMLMPNGIAPTAAPCNERPMISGSSDEKLAQTTEPAMSASRFANSTRRLPNMSPRRPAIGVNTAPASSVEVITQDAFEAEVSSSVGSAGMIG